MNKNIWKIALFALLFISILIVPIVGVEFYESDSIFDEGAVYMDHDFGKGSKITLTCTPNEGSDITIDKAAEILEKRFSEFGFSDSKVEKSGENIVVSIPVVNALEDVISEVGIVGDWNLSDMSSNVFCDASFIDSSEVKVASNGYYLSLNIKDEAKETIESKVNLIKSSGSAYAFMYMDNSIAGYVNLSDDAAYSNDRLLVGPFEYSSAARTNSIINNGKLDATLKIENIEEYAPKFAGAAAAIIYAVCGIILIALCIILILKNKSFGIAASLALISDAAIMLTALANGSYIFNLATLIAMILALGCIFALSYYSLSKFGKLKDSKIIVSSILYHLAVFVVTVILWMTTKSTVFSIARVFMIASVASFCTYFIFTFAFGKVLQELKSNK